MKFMKFSILNLKPGQTQETEEVEVLFNVDHIISIKPIRIARPDKLINGFWIRTTNGKKYKASKIPGELLEIIGEKYQGSVSINLDFEDSTFHQ